jgi:hypothetical protein
MKANFEMCACGQPLHYVSPDVEVATRALIKQLGPDIRVTIAYEKGLTRTWLVPRHYIALHGIRGEDLPTLGFPEVKD